MLIRGPDVVGTLKALAPPFDAETERELLAVAFGSMDAKARGLAHKLVAKHVKNAALIKSTLGPGFHGRWDAGEKLRRLKYPERGKLAVAMRAHGANVAGVAFEEDEAFMRDRMYRMVTKRELDLHEWYMTPNRVESVKLHTIPDAFFDELPRLHKKKPFDKLTLWATPIRLPKRFVEFAPYLKHLTIGFCNFTELPDVVCECTKLETLELHDYTLERLNPKLPKLKKLKKLLLARSKKLKALPPEVCKLPSLQHLALWFARYKTLPPELKSLNTLELYSTSITRMPELPGVKIK